MMDEIRRKVSDETIKTPLLGTLGLGARRKLNFHGHPQKGNKITKRTNFLH